MKHGSHPKPTAYLPQSDDPWRKPGDTEERAKLKRAKEAQGERNTDTI